MTRISTASAALAVTGIAFFAGALVTLNMISSAPLPQYDQVTRAASPALLSSDPAAAAAPAPAAPLPAAVTPVAATEAPAATAPLTTALSVPRPAPAPAPAAAAPAEQIALIQQASQAYRVIGNSESLDGNTKRVVLVGLQGGKDEQGLQEMLGNAARSGLIAIPEGLNTADGGVDTRSLLLNIVERAVQENDLRSAEQRQVAALPTAQTRPAARAPRTEATVYTVEPGDSLAFIALQFYGSTGDFRRIFEANRDKLSNPNRISVGQRLVIPASG